MTEPVSPSSDGQDPVRRAMEERQRLDLSVRETAAFVDALLEPRPVNERLRATVGSLSQSDGRSTFGRDGLRVIVAAGENTGSTMADTVTNELFPETLKAVQARLSDMAGDLSDMKADMRGLKGHMAAFRQSEVAQDGAIARN